MSASRLTCPHCGHVLYIHAICSGQLNGPDEQSMAGNPGKLELACAPQHKAREAKPVMPRPWNTDDRTAGGG